MAGDADQAWQVQEDASVLVRRRYGATTAREGQLSRLRLHTERHAMERIGWLRAAKFVIPTRLGITGYCWGGTVVWRTAMQDPEIKAGVAFYGRLDTIIPRAAELKAPVLGLYAGKDQG
ncbi:MAG: hypothetical protein EON57_02770, partial [Alphaproteobacteria bacterium]